jgi:adenylate kinase family enzyme
MEPNQTPGRRIAVVGTSGSGKTYVAEALARRLDLTYVSHDAIIWRANWQETPRDEVYADVDAATQAEGWTYDGNLGPRPPDQLVLSRCDTLVWLDLPRREVWWSVVQRSLRRVIGRTKLWHGNVERWGMLVSTDSIIWWSVKTFARRRRVYGALFADPAYADKTRIRLRSRREVNDWLASLPTLAPQPSTGPG